MNIKSASAICLCLAMSYQFSHDPKTGHWKKYKNNSEGFFAFYPPDWNPVKGTSQRNSGSDFDIINFPNSERWKGVVIKKNGAEIIGGKISSLTNTTDELVRQDLGGAPPIDQRDVSGNQKIPSSCSSLRIVTWTTDESGSGTAYVFNTTYYCATARGVYRFWLRNWKDDPHQAQYQETTHSIVLSLRVF